MKSEGLKNIRSYEYDEQEFLETVEGLNSSFRHLGETALNSLENSTEPEDDPANWQAECLEAIRDKHEVILSSPTGSGKTRVFMEWASEKPERPIYITAPIKALSNQRYRELEAAGVKVGLETGDIKNLPEDAEIICCTQEIYTNKYVDNENATLIVDEFHYIFENPDRQRAYIDGIHDSKAKNVLLCSATLGNTAKVNNYVNRVSGRDFFMYENDKRLTTLEYGGEISAGEIKDALVVAFSARKCDGISSSVAANRAMNFDLRYNSLEGDEDAQDDLYYEKLDRQQSIDELAAEYDVKQVNQDVYEGVSPYYGAMLPKEKLFIEKLFEEGLIDTVVGTDALALGVNFPVEKVVFSELDKRVSGPISKNLFDQLGGRAGRKGYFDHGIIYYTSDFGDGSYYNDQLYDNLKNAKNEDVSVILQPKLKDILAGKRTPEEEAEYLRQFSELPEVVRYYDSEDGSYFEEKPHLYDADRIRGMIDEIKSYDFDFLIPYDIKNSQDWFDLRAEKSRFRLSKEGREKYHYFAASPYHNQEYPDGPDVIYDSEAFRISDWRDRYEQWAHYAYKITEGKFKELDGTDKDWPNISVFCTKNPTTGKWTPAIIESDCPEDEGEFINYVDLRKQYFEDEEKLRPEFLANIADVYDDELSPEDNCFLFSRILTGATVKELQDSYLGDQNNFRDLLQFRKYLRHLPRKYRRTLDLKSLDDEINQIDWTALNLNRGALKTEDLKETTNE